MSKLRLREVKITSVTQLELGQALIRIHINEFQINENHCCFLPPALELALLSTDDMADGARETDILHFWPGIKILLCVCAHVCACSCVCEYMQRCICSSSNLSILNIYSMSIPFLFLALWGQIDMCSNPSHVISWTSYLTSLNFTFLI